MMMDDTGTDYQVDANHDQKEDGARSGNTEAMPDLLSTHASDLKVRT